MGDSIKSGGIGDLKEEMSSILKDLGNLIKQGSEETYEKQATKHIEKATKKAIENGVAQGAKKAKPVKVDLSKKIDTKWSEIKSITEGLAEAKDEEREAEKAYTDFFTKENESIKKRIDTLEKKVAADLRILDNEEKRSHSAKRGDDTFWKEMNKDQKKNQKKNANLTPNDMAAVFLAEAGYDPKSLKKIRNGKKGQKIVADRIDLLYPEDEEYINSLKKNIERTKEIFIEIGKLLEYQKLFPKESFNSDISEELNDMVDRLKYYAEIDDEIAELVKNIDIGKSRAKQTISNKAEKLTGYDQAKTRTGWKQEDLKVATDEMRELIPSFLEELKNKLSSTLTAEGLEEIQEQLKKIQSISIDLGLDEQLKLTEDLLDNVSSLYNSINPNGNESNSIGDVIAKWIKESSQISDRLKINEKGIYYNKLTGELSEQVEGTTSEILANELDKALESLKESTDSSSFHLHRSDMASFSPEDIRRNAEEIFEGVYTHYVAGLKEISYIDFSGIQDEKELLNIADEFETELLHRISNWLSVANLQDAFNKDQTKELVASKIKAAVDDLSDIIYKELSPSYTHNIDEDTFKLQLQSMVEHYVQNIDYGKVDLSLLADNFITSFLPNASDAHLIRTGIVETLGNLFHSIIIGSSISKGGDAAREQNQQIIKDSLKSVISKRGINPDDVYKSLSFNPTDKNLASILQNFIKSNENYTNAFKNIVHETRKSEESTSDEYTDVLDKQEKNVDDLIERYNELMKVIDELKGKLDIPSINRKLSTSSELGEIAKQLQDAGMVLGEGNKWVNATTSATPSTKSNSVKGELQDWLNFQKRIQESKQDILDGGYKLIPFAEEFKDLVNEFHDFANEEAGIKKIVDRLKELYALRKTDNFEGRHGNEIVILQDFLEGVGASIGNKNIEKYFNNRFEEARETLKKYAELVNEAPGEMGDFINFWESDSSDVRSFEEFINDIVKAREQLTIFKERFPSKEDLTKGLYSGFKEVGETYNILIGILRHGGISASAAINEMNEALAQAIPLSRQEEESTSAINDSFDEISKKAEEVGKELYEEGSKQLSFIEGVEKTENEVSKKVKEIAKDVKQANEEGAKSSSQIEGQMSFDDLARQADSATDALNRFHKESKTIFAKFGNQITDIPVDFQSILYDIQHNGLGVEDALKRLEDILANIKKEASSDSGHNVMDDINKSAKKAEDSVSDVYKVLSTIHEYIVDSDGNLVENTPDNRTFSYKERAGRRVTKSLIKRYDENGEELDPLVSIKEQTSYTEIVKQATKAILDLTKAEHNLDIEQKKGNPNKEILESYLSLIDEAIKKYNEASAAADKYFEENREFYNDRGYDSKYLRQAFIEDVSDQTTANLTKEEIRYLSAIDNISEKAKKSNDSLIKQLGRASRKIENIQFTYDKTLSPGVSRPVTTDTYLKQLANAKSEIENEINRLRTQGYASQSELDSLETLINSYNNLAKALKAADNATKREMGGQQTNTAIEQELAFYDGLIDRAKQYGKASESIVDALEEQRRQLEKNRTIEELYYSQDIRKVNKARLQSVETKYKRDTKTEKNQEKEWLTSATQKNKQLDLDLYVNKLKEFGLLTQDVREQVEGLVDLLNTPSSNYGFKFFDLGFSLLKKQMAESIEEAKKLKKENEAIFNQKSSEIAAQVAEKELAQDEVYKKIISLKNRISLLDPETDKETIKDLNEQLIKFKKQFLSIQKEIKSLTGDSSHYFTKRSGHFSSIAQGVTDENKQDLANKLANEYKEVTKEIYKLKKKELTLDANKNSRELADTKTTIDLLEERQKVLKSLCETQEELINLEQLEGDISKITLQGENDLQATRSKLTDSYAEKLKNLSKKINSIREDKITTSVMGSINEALKVEEFAPFNKETLNKRISDLKEHLNDPSMFDELKSGVSDITRILDIFNTTLKETSKNATRLSGVAFEKLSDKFNKFVSDNTGVPKKYKEYIKGLQDAFNELKRKFDAGEATNINALEFQENLSKISSKFKEAGVGGKSFFDIVSNRLKSINASFISMYFSFYDWVRYIRTAVTTVKELDSALIELKKVSDASTSRLSQSFDTSAKTAQELGSTITEVINATADWSRAGFNIDEAEELARVTTLYQNVGDNIDSATANEHLISALRGFHKTADEAEHIVDVYNEIANNFSIDTAGIGAALQRSAAVFYNSATDLESAVALVTGANEIVQDPERIGVCLVA